MAAVLFDWDGTLLDSQPTTTATWREVLDHVGVSLDDAELNSLFYLGWPHAYRWLCDRAPMPDLEATAAMLRSARRHHTWRLRLFADVRPCLDGLRDAGIRLALITNSYATRLDTDLERARLPRTAFDVVVTADD